MEASGRVLLERMGAKIGSGPDRDRPRERLDLGNDGVFQNRPDGITCEEIGESERTSSSIPNHPPIWFERSRDVFHAGSADEVVWLLERSAGRFVESNGSFDPRSPFTISRRCELGIFREGGSRRSDRITLQRLSHPFEASSKFIVDSINE